MASSFLKGLLSSLFERRGDLSTPVDKRKIDEQCNALLTTTGEISGIQTARAIFDNYNSFNHEERKNFFNFLTENLDLDPEKVRTSAIQYQGNPTSENLAKLVSVAEPPRQELLRRLNQAPNATANLVRMRLDLLELIEQNETFKRSDIDFTHLLSSWFNRGFLVLRRINWETPANILEKIIQYEAVHTINDWNDLRRRTEPIDRRCFAYFHPVMPDDPLIFVEVALVKGVPSSIQEVLAEERNVLSSDQFDTAVFYSISNCQAGLKGITLGNSLIKQVVEDLSWELPQLKTFVTLSPIPRFRAWLEKNRDMHPEINSILTLTESEKLDEIKSELAAQSRLIQSLAAKYILDAKRSSDNFPLDSVARFHLGNGASVHDVHAAADISTNGLHQSCGAMVNYLYELKKVAINHENFVEKKLIPASKIVLGLAREISKQLK